MNPRRIRLANRIPLAGFLVVPILILVLAGVASAETINRIAAVVDNEVVTVFEVERESRPAVQAYLSSAGGDSAEERAAHIQEIKKQTLRDIIEKKLLEAEVQRLGIPVEEQDVDNYIRKILAANRMTREDLTMQLAREGKSMDEFRGQIRKQILREEYVGFRLKDRVKVAEEDARAYYQQHSQEYIADTKITLSEIRFNLPAEVAQPEVKQIFDRAAATYEQLVAGADFEETAKRVSSGVTAKNGGKLGTFLLEKELKPDYRRAAADLKAGDISTVYRDPMGFFILKCIDRNPSGTLPFEDVEEKITMQLRREAAEREMRKLAQELYKKSYVDIKIDKFDAQ